MKNFFNYLFSRSNTFLFFLGLGLSIFLTASFFYLFFDHPDLLYKNLNRQEFSIFHNTTILGKIFMISGIFPNFILLILIFRLIRFVLINLLKLIGKILDIIFSDKNINKFQEIAEKIEKTLIANKPKVEKAITKIKLKKKIKKDYLIPISLIVSASIIALAIFFQ